MTKLISKRYEEASFTMKTPREPSVLSLRKCGIDYQRPSVTLNPFPLSNHCWRPICSPWHTNNSYVLGAVTLTLFPSQLQLLLLPPFSHRSTGPFTSTYSIPSQFLLLLPNLTSVFKSFYISLISINFRIIACFIGLGVLVWWFWFCNIGDVFNWVYIFPIQLFVICDSEWYHTLWGAKLLDRLLFDSDSVNTYIC